MTLLCKIVGDELNEMSDVYVESNEAVFRKYNLMLGNGLTKTVDNFMQVRMAYFTSSVKC